MNDKQTPPQKSSIDTDYIEGLVNVKEVHLNVSQEVIVTTEDKVRLCLSEHLKRMEKKRSWIAPLGILVTIALTLFTSTFKDLGLDAATWRAIFIIGSIISSGWLIYSVKEALHSAKIEDIVTELKKDSKALKK